jgi:hypothetical protein
MHAATTLRRAAIGLALAAGLLSANAWPSAQAPAKKVLGIDDYTKWRTITAQEISGDGNWVAYVQSLTNSVQSDA